MEHKQFYHSLFFLANIDYTICVVWQNQNPQEMPFKKSQNLNVFNAQNNTFWWKHWCQGTVHRIQPLDLLKIYFFFWFKVWSHTACNNSRCYLTESTTTINRLIMHKTFPIFFTHRHNSVNVTIKRVQTRVQYFSNSYIHVAEWIYYFTLPFSRGMQQPNN